MTIQPYQIMPVGADWSAGVTIKYKYNTLITVAERLKEQRIMKRGTPYMEMSINVLISDMKLIDYYQASAGVEFYAPIFCEGVLPISHGTGLEIVSTSNYMNYFNMRHNVREIVVMSKTGTRNPEVIAVVGIGNNVLSLDTNTWVWDDDTIIFPALRAVLIDVQKTSVNAGLFECSIQFAAFTDGLELSISRAGADEDFPIIHNWEALPSTSYNPNREIQQFNLGVIGIRVLSSRMPWTMSLNHLNTKDDAYALIKFFCEHRGRFRSFWLMLPDKYLELNTTIYEFSSLFAITSDSYGNVFESGQWVFFKLYDGTVIKKQIVSRLSEGVYSVSVPFSQRIFPEDVILLGRYIKCRFDQDELELQYVSCNLSECKVNIVELTREYESPVVS